MHRSVVGHVFQNETQAGCRHTSHMLSCKALIGSEALKQLLSLPLLQDWLLLWRACVFVAKQYSYWSAQP